MNRYLLFFIFFLVYLACKNKEITPVMDETARMAAAETNFKKFCSTCHGDNGDVFVDRRWKHGTTRDSIIMNINSGFPELGMPLWDSLINDQETADLADYLLKAIEKRKQFDFKDSLISNTFTHNSETVKLDTIAKGLDNPWGMAFLPDGVFVYADRNGNLYRNVKGVQSLVKGAPPVLAEGQGGLLDIELHPDFDANKLLYLSYSKFKFSAGEKWSTTAILKAKWMGDKLA